VTKSNTKNVESWDRTWDMETGSRLYDSKDSTLHYHKSEVAYYRLGSSLLLKG